MDEYKLLIYILDFCEENGDRHGNVCFNVDHELVEEIYDRYGIQPSIDELKGIVDRCYAREWLEHGYIGSGRHNGLKLTSKGMGVATSKRKTEELKNNRSVLKKTSDYIEDHKGLFILLGAMIALSSLIFSLLTKGSGNG